MRYLKCVGVVSVFLMTIAFGVAYGADNCASSNDALAVANAFVAKRWPYELKPPYPSPTTKDADDVWMVIYDIPEGWTGGGQTFYIDKKTCKVIQIIAEQ